MAPPVDLAADSEAYATSQGFEMPTTSGARDVGICAMEMYVPSMFVSQSELGACFFFIPRCFLIFLCRKL